MISLCYVNYKERIFDVKVEFWEKAKLQRWDKVLLVFQKLGICETLPQLTSLLVETPIQVPARETLLVCNTS